MSSGDPSLNFPGDESATGATSAEKRPVVPSQDARERLRQGLSSGLSVYEYLLLASLVFVTLACFQMYLNVNRVGIDPQKDQDKITNFPFSNPYKVEEALIGGGSGS